MKLLWNLDLLKNKQQWLYGTCRWFCLYCDKVPCKLVHQHNCFYLINISHDLLSFFVLQFTMQFVIYILIFLNCSTFTITPWYTQLWKSQDGTDANMQCSFFIGRAIVTTQEFERGDFLLQYLGILLTSDVAEALEADEDKSSVFRYFFSFKGKTYWWVMSTNSTVNFKGRCSYFCQVSYRISDKWGIIAHSYS